LFPFNKKFCPAVLAAGLLCYKPVSTVCLPVYIFFLSRRLSFGSLEAVRSKIKSSFNNNFCPAIFAAGFLYYILKKHIFQTFKTCVF